MPGRDGKDGRQVSVRFAPSPTGRLHIGNIRTAVINWLFAHRSGGRFLLRLDDTDRERSSEAFADGIREDLAWLGLRWDTEARQSDRLDRYEAAAEDLKNNARLYPCYETPEELDRKRKRQLGRGRPPVYDRAALQLSAEDRAALEREGRQPHWRLLLEDRSVVWDDLVRGRQTIDAASLSDPILIRADGSYLYTLPSVIDDIDFAITHVIRGEDHVANTGAQIQLFEALGAAPPVFGHHNLLVGADGQALSKRSGDLSIAGLREAGLEPLAVLAHAALIGTSDAIAPYTEVSELVSLFDPGKLSRAPARFDPAELTALNARLLHMLEFDAVADRLEALDVKGGPDFWYAVRGNLQVLGDAAQWWQVVDGPIDPVIENATLADRAAELLPDEPWDGATWGDWTAEVKSATGAKGRALFHPLRLALTGEESGPELKALLPLIGRDKALARLKGEAR